MNRRKFVKNTGLLMASFTAIPPVLQGCMDHSDMDMDSNGFLVSEGAFNTPITFPHVVLGNVSMVAKANNATLLGNSPSSVLGYGQGILGPTIKVDTGTD